MGYVASASTLLCTVCWLAFERADSPACRGCGTAQPAGGWPELPYRFRGRYRFEAQLGRGGMGAVFRAFDEQSPDRPWVAVKVAQLKGDASSRHALEEAFRREGRAAAMLSEHPRHFVGFRGSDFSSPAHLVMDFIDWPTLKALRQQHGTLSAIDVARIGVEVLRGVRYMERRRMVHRDLKPENIFAARTAAGFDAKLADFGVWVESGEAYDTSLFGTTDSVRLAGTPSYMSPEQIRGDALTSASDLHMVASVLWELATGSVPYPMASGPLLEALRDRHDRLRTPRERPPGMPEPLHRILTTALRFEAHERGFADTTADVTSNGPSDASVVRGMEKALEKFVHDHQEGLRRALDSARIRVDQTRLRLDHIESTLAHVGPLMNRAAQLRTGIQTSLRSDANPEAMEAEAAQLSASVDRLAEDMATALGLSDTKTALAEAGRQLARERAQAEDARQRVEGFERRLAVAGERERNRRVAFLSLGLASALVGGGVGALAAGPAGAGQADAPPAASAGVTAPASALTPTPQLQTAPSTSDSHAPTASATEPPVPVPSLAATADSPPSGEGAKTPTPRWTSPGGARSAAAPSSGPAVKTVQTSSPPATAGAAATKTAPGKPQPIDSFD